MLSRGPACGDATAETSKAADSTELESCRKQFRGCAQAADAWSFNICRERYGGRTRSNGRWLADQRAGTGMND